MNVSKRVLWSHRVFPIHLNKHEVADTHVIRTFPLIPPPQRLKLFITDLKGTSHISMLSCKELNKSAAINVNSYPAILTQIEILLCYVVDKTARFDFAILMQLSARDMTIEVNTKRRNKIHTKEINKTTLDPSYFGVHKTDYNNRVGPYFPRKLLATNGLVSSI